MSGAGRVLAGAGALVLALLVAEGALSLLARRSLTELGPASATRREPPRAPGPGDAATDEVAEPEAAEGLDDAIFAAHEDPLVGYVLKPDSELAIYDGAIATDHLGLRRRPGPPPADDALRVVVLGDSIAFGFGVGDDECLAARLEARLAELRGPGGGRPVACRTVAVPSWNHRAAPAFLLDHWDELRPDVVLYLPCRNDVCDIDGATAQGQRRVTPDASSPDPWLSISVRTLVQNDARRLLAGQGGELHEVDLGHDALFSDVCQESRRRHDECAQSVARLQRVLAARGCRFALVWNTLSDYTWFLTSRLARLAPDVPAIVMLGQTRDEFTLGFDPHPNATTLDVWARWLAAELVERGWVSPGEGHALPPVPDEYAEDRGSMPAPEDVERLAEEARERAGRWLRPDIDFRRGFGVVQVLGGLNPGGTARENLLVALAPQGSALELELEPLVSRPDLYPLPIEVEVDGVSLGRVSLRVDERLGERLLLPAGLDRSRPVEVRLVPERWVVRRLDPAPGSAREGPMILDWCRPARIAIAQ